MAEMYCAHCRTLTDEAPCPVCGSAALRPPAETDVCFLAERGNIWSGILADVLASHQIPFLKKGRMGAGLTLAADPMLESYRFYVPYSRLAEARDLAEDVFSDEAEEN